MEGSLQYDIRELGKKIDALLGLLIAFGRSFGSALPALPWPMDWVADYLLGFDLSEEYVTRLTGLTKEEVLREKVKAKTRKVPRKPSFLDRFKED